MDILRLYRNVKGDKQLVKVKDIVNLMNPWQELIIRKQGDTQLNDPIFQTEMSLESLTWTTPNNIVSEMTVVELESSWNATVLYVK